MSHEKVEEGVTFVVDGVTYRFRSGSAEAYNHWLVQVQRGLPPENGIPIDVYEEDGEGARLLRPTQIQKALEEQEE